MPRQGRRNACSRQYGKGEVAMLAQQAERILAMAWHYSMLQGVKENWKRSTTNRGKKQLAIWRCDWGKRKQRYVRHKLDGHRAERDGDVGMSIPPTVPLHNTNNDDSTSQQAPTPDVELPGAAPMPTPSPMGAMSNPTPANPARCRPYAHTKPNGCHVYPHARSQTEAVTANRSS